MKIVINQTELARLENELKTKLQSGCVAGADILRSVTPIDTQRLWSTTRAGDVTKVDDMLECRIIAGGESAYGIQRETDVEKEVDYAVFVESRQHYARGALVAIKKAILGQMK